MRKLLSQIGDVLNLSVDLDRAYLRQYSSYSDEIGTVGNLMVLAFERCPFQRRRYTRSKVIGPYLCQYWSYSDDIGTVGKLSISASEDMGD